MAPGGDAVVGNGVGLYGRGSVPGDASEDDEDLGWGWPRITLTRAEVPDALVPGLYDAHHWVDGRLALALAREGKPLLRSAYGRRA